MLQPKYFVNFAVFKPDFRKAKQISVKERTLAGMLLDLSWPILVQVTCELWERTFSKECNSVDWRYGGLNPFICAWSTGCGKRRRRRSCTAQPLCSTLSH